MQMSKFTGTRFLQSCYLIPRQVVSFLYRQSRTWPWVPFVRYRGVLLRRSVPYFDEMDTDKKIKIDEMDTDENKI
jgi:hypothetical protein